MSKLLEYSEESNDVISVHSETDSVQFVSSTMNDHFDESDDVVSVDKVNDSDESNDVVTVDSDSESMQSEVSGKMNQSEESNDMLLNHPDIESVENIRTANKILTVKLDSVPVTKKIKLSKEERLAVREQKANEKLERQKLREERKQQRLKEKELAEIKAIKKREEREKEREEEAIRKIQKAEERERRMLEFKRIKEENKKHKKAAEEEALKKRKEQALKGMKYLLNVSTKYSDFFKEKLTKTSKESATARPLHERNKLQPTIKDMKEAVDVEEKMDVKTKVTTDITKQLTFFDGGELRDYQIEGVQWMANLFDNGINGILADEMGLGKTVQVIALIAHMMERKVAGPYLIVAPLSTIPNWEMEFERFAKKIPVVVFHGSEAERKEQCGLLNRKHIINGIAVRPVVLTTYQVPLYEQRYMNNIEWQYIIIDEGHRIKNHESQLSMILRSFNSANRLLLTGTPIHNNITELWALLNFLMPHIFNNLDTFASLLMLEDVQDENKLIEQEEKTNFIATLHRVLEPFVLRRLKKDVLGEIVPKKELNIFCPLTKLQHDLYNYVINKNIQMLVHQKEEEPLGPRRKKKRVNYYETEDNSDDSDFEDELGTAAEEMVGQNIEKTQLKCITRLTMANPWIMFKKIVDHPYLVHFPLDQEAEEKTLLINEDLISASGKMMVLDQVLAKLKKDGHKVLIFSTLVMTLDLIEELFIMRKYRYCRLDGSMNRESRKENIESFNKDPGILAFLLSTRSGGLGLNLVGADTVIFFDRDWNPQVDIQAQDRCHRIGQTKPVMVYSLIAKNTIDSAVLNKGYQKRLLEKLVIKDGKFCANKSQQSSLQDELKALQKLLTEEITDFDNLTIPTDELNKLLDRSELWSQMKLDEEKKKKKK